MTLFDFSLLTKMSPVSLAAAERSPAPAAMTPRQNMRRSIGTGVALRLQSFKLAASVRPIKAAEQAKGPTGEHREREVERRAAGAAPRQRGQVLRTRARRQRRELYGQGR